MPVELHTGQAFLAGPTDVLGISKADTVANFDVGDVASDLTHDTGALVAKNLASFQVVLIGAAEAGMGGFDVDLVMLQSASRLVRHNLSLLRTTEDVECHAHDAVLLQ